MSVFPHTVNEGDPIDPQNWNRIIDQLKRSRFNSGVGVSVTSGPSGTLITHNKDCFWGEVVATGPLGTEDNYDDQRYWLKEKYISNTSGNSATATTLTDKTNGLHVTASNIAETSTNIHNTPLNKIVKVWIEKDAGDNKQIRYLFEYHKIVYVHASISASGVLRAFSGSGNTDWDYDPVGGGFGIAFDDNQMVYTVGRLSGGITVWKLNPLISDTDNPVWDYNTGSTAEGVAVDSNGSVFVATNVNVALKTVIKLSSSGSLLDDYYTGHDAKGIATDVDGNIYVAGRRNNNIDATFRNVWKLDSALDLVWGHDTTDAQEEDIAVDVDGNVYVAGGRDATNNSVHKINSAGSNVWDYDTGDVAHSIAVDIAGNVYIAGARSGNKSVWKLDSSGNLLWDYDTGKITLGIDVDLVGNVYVCGSVNVGKSIWKLDSSGNLLWDKSVDSTQDIATRVLP